MGYWEQVDKERIRTGAETYDEWLLIGLVILLIIILEILT